MKQMFLNSSLLLILACIAHSPAKSQERKDPPTAGTYIEAKENGKQYRLVMTGNALSELYVDGRRIPADSLDRYNGAVKVILDKMQAQGAMVEEDRRRLLVKQLQSLQYQQQQLLVQQEMLEAQQQELKEKQRMLLGGGEAFQEPEEPEAPGEPAELREAAEWDEAHANKALEEARIREKVVESDRVRVFQDREKEKERAEKARAEKAMLEKEIAGIDKTDKERLAYMQGMRNMIAELITDKIVPDEKSLSSFALSDQELLVNDQRMPATIHKRYKAKYIRQAGFGIYYGKVRNLGNGVFMTREDLYPR